MVTRSHIAVEGSPLGNELVDPLFLDVYLYFLVLCVSDPCVSVLCRLCVFTPFLLFGALIGPVKYYVQCVRIF